MSDLLPQDALTPPISENEAERLAALYRYGVLDTPPEASFDPITRLAARLLNVPTALISLVDESRAWIKSSVGFDVPEVPRDSTLCSFAVLIDEPLIVPDARLDDRFIRCSSMQQDLGARFYAGAPLISHDGFNVGTLCVLDEQPRSLTAEQQASLVDLAALVVDELELRLAADKLAQVEDRSLLSRLATEPQQQAETALRDSEEHYRALTELSPQIVFVSQPNGFITYCNRWGLEFTGRSLLDLQGNRWVECIHPQHCERVFSAWTNALANGTDYEVEVLIRRADGVYRWFYARAVPVKKAGDITHWIGIGLDISDRKQAEEDLAHSRYRFEKIAATTPDLVYVYDLLEDRNIYVNTGIKRMLGYSPSQIADLGVGLIGALIHPDDIPGVVAGNQRFNEMSNEEVYDHELRMRHVRGDYRWLRCRDTVFERAADGTATKIIGTAQDVTDRKATEDALRESEDRLRLALASAELGIWDWNLSAQELTWDTRCKAMFGLSADAPITYEVHLAAIHPDDRNYVYESGLQALNPQNGAFNAEYRAIGIEDGVERWIAAKGKVIFDNLDVPARFVGTVLNVTEKKRIEAEREQLLRREQAAREEAERANRLKDEFLAVLSHELRSPLNPILGWTRLLQNGSLDATHQQQALATIERNAKLQSQLIEDLLDISRIMQGKLTLTAAPVNLFFVISAAVETVRLAAEAKAIQLTLNLDSAIAPVSGDGARLQQVLWNLLTNAVKFTPQGGQVEVTLELMRSDGDEGMRSNGDEANRPLSPLIPQSDFAQITVRDTGKGIAAEFLPHVFDYFRQEDGSTTRKFGGLGLGLAIARQIVEMHGGTIEVESQGEGAGSTFIVRLPLPRRAEQRGVEGDADRASQRMTDASLAASALPLRGLQILVVDDEPDARDFQAFLLEQSGATVIAAASGLEALQALDRGVPDLLVSDVGMPDMDGYMLMQQVRSRSSSQGGELPAIALTAYARDLDRQRALQAGFTAHITKPVDPDGLVEAIVDLL
jgi:PAS domain S-box-containing protein